MPVLLTTAEAAGRLNRSTQQLYRWRAQGRGPESGMVETAYGIRWDADKLRVPPARRMGRPPLPITTPVTP